MAGVFSLRGRSALITGGGSGLGAHFAKVLASAGARVAICGRREDKLREVAANYSDEDILFPIAMDVTCSESVARGFDDAESALGVPRGGITIVVNNAGISGMPRPWIGVKESDFDAVVATNLKGTWLVAQEAVKRIKGGPEKKGSVVNVASILGHHVARGVAPYAASKAGVLHVTRAMALELARTNIRVNALCPGYFETEMNTDFFQTEKGKRSIAEEVPSGRLGEMHELDGALLLFCSDAGTFIQGASLDVDGGHSLKGLM